MGPRPRGRGTPAAGAGALKLEGLFNGATASRPWNPPPPRRRGEPELLVQWGHGLAAVEPQRVRRRRAARQGVQWGHGLAAVEPFIALNYREPTAKAFNGATASRPWNPPAAGDLLSRVLEVQWGHGLAA